MMDLAWRADEPLTEDDIPAVDWQGGAIDCGPCPQRTSGARCSRGHACVHDRYAKRIDRFFKWNPALGNDFLDHPYFEVRAIACRHADVFRLQSLIADPDETVRLSVAVRLPLSQVLRLRDDPHREVRIRVAMRLEGADLLAMAYDPDYYVRKLVARRLPQALLPRMVDDREWEVRLETAKRLGMPALLRLCEDPEVAVRRELVHRLPEPQLERMARDPAWEVRWEVAQLAGRALAMQLAEHDEEEEVRQAAALRLAELAARRSAAGVPTLATRTKGARHG